MIQSLVVEKFQAVFESYYEGINLWGDILEGFTFDLQYIPETQTLRFQIAAPEELEPEQAIDDFLSYVGVELSESACRVNFPEQSSFCCPLSRLLVSRVQLACGDTVHPPFCPNYFWYGYYTALEEGFDLHQLYTDAQENSKPIKLTPPAIDTVRDWLEKRLQKPEEVIVTAYPNHEGGSVRFDCTTQRGVALAEKAIALFFNTDENAAVMRILLNGQRCHHYQFW